MGCDQRDKGWILIDAGWMALSQDRGTCKHGIITVRPGPGSVLPALAIGDRVRILPNHGMAVEQASRFYLVIT